jgi:hypothetical protein
VHSMALSQDEVYKLTGNRTDIVWVNGIRCSFTFVTPARIATTFTSRENQ